MAVDSSSERPAIPGPLDTKLQPGADKEGPKLKLMEWPQSGVNRAVARILKAVVADVARGGLAGSPDFDARSNWQHGELSRRHRLIGGTGVYIQESNSGSFGGIARDQVADVVAFARHLANAIGGGAI
jgi:hypothetical protein